MRRAKTQQVFVVLGCVIHDGAVLLVRRNKPSVPELHNKLELPGGKIRFGENLHSAAEREVLEETGIAVQAERLLDFPYIRVRTGTHRRIHVIALCYTCTPLSDTRITVDCLQAEWRRLDQIDPFEIQTGSLSFISEVMRQGDSNYTVPTPRKAWLKLRSTNHSASRDWRYDITIAATINDKSARFVITCSRGSRIKSVDEFNNRDTMLARLEKILKKGLEHGYVLHSKSEYFPFAFLPSFKQLKVDSSPYGQLELFANEAE
jgi:8-oxo-dGTP diphosphatase